jgi:hypothetical protein
MKYALYLHRWKESLQSQDKGLPDLHKIEEAINSKQTEAHSQGYTGTPGSVAYNAPPPPPMPRNGSAPAQGQGNQNDGYLPSKGHIMSMIHPMPKSKKEQNSISR